MLQVVKASPQSHKVKGSELSLGKSGSNTSSRASSPLSKLETLSIEKTKKTDEATPQRQVVMRKTELNVSDEFKKTRGDAKEALNLIVIGHVDSGKSTLMGHLLFQLGQVSFVIVIVQGDIHRREQPDGSHALPVEIPDHQI